MTAFLILSAIVVLAELVAGVRFLRRDRPVQPPTDHLDWGSKNTPARSYSLRS